MKKDISIAAPHTAFSDFERQYLLVREKEQRIYTDEELRQLPNIHRGHPRRKEWESRSRSADMFVRHLGEKNKYLNVLDVGCGNGWLSAKIAQLDNTDVTGLDVNLTELEQASRVWDRGNLRFVYGDIRDECRARDKFDIVVFAASVQYFRSLAAIIDTAFSLLSVGGEIHILDTPFYTEPEVHAARKRTAEYYIQMGHPAMSDYYFHHLKDDLKAFNAQMMFDPHKKINKLFRRNLPFHWVCIKQ